MKIFYNLLYYSIKFFEYTLYLSIPLIFLFIIGYYGIYKSIYADDIPNSKKTIATVYSIKRDAKGSSCHTIYIVKGDTFENRISNVNGSCVGDKYLIKYDSLNPERSWILKEYPLFEPDEPTTQVTGIIVKVLKHSVRFAYILNGNKYLRFQKFDDSINRDSIQKGQKYLVHAWAINPQRSVIYLDKPLE